MLLRQERTGQGRKLEQLLGIPQPDHHALRNQFRNRFVGLALEALRREEISRAKLVEVAAMVGLNSNNVDHAIADLGLHNDEGTHVQLVGYRG